MTDPAARIPDPSDFDAWRKAELTPLLLRGEWPQPWVRTQPFDACVKRLRQMLSKLKLNWVGLASDSGHLLDWLVATLVARENPVLLGLPGVAKTEIALAVLGAIGLEQPRAPSSENTGYASSPTIPPVPSASLTSTATQAEIWFEREEARQRGQQKYFHFMLTRFTQPEELFGPLEISLLRQGRYVRVNFGFLTGAGVYGAFLDEIFKATGSILNTLLTLSQERYYFNWGRMNPADLVSLIGASNELPGAFRRGAGSAAESAEDFDTLRAFLDRFPIRLAVPALQPVQGTTDEGDLFKALNKAQLREARRFSTGRSFEQHEPDTCINDLLLVGRGALQHWIASDQSCFDDSALAKFDRSFKALARALWIPDPEREPRWYLSVRKLKALYKVALCHALLTAEPSNGRYSIGPEQLWVFSLIWDSEDRRADLDKEVRALIRQGRG